MSNTGLLCNFGHNLNAAIIGASGGIGHAFINHLCAQENIETIYAFSRSTPSFQDKKIIAHSLDITDEKSILTAAQSVDDTSLDIIIVATGLLHDDSQMPEKSLRDLNKKHCLNMFLNNTVGPALNCETFSTSHSKRPP